MLQLNLNLIFFAYEYDYCCYMNWSISDNIFEPYAIYFPDAFEWASEKL